MLAALVARLSIDAAPQRASGQNRVISFRAATGSRTEFDHALLESIPG